MRAFHVAVAAALAAAAFTAVGVAPAGATVTTAPFSATDVTQCTGTSHVTVSFTAQNPDPIHQAADIAVVVDDSGSIGTANFNSARASIDNLITSAAPSATGNRIGVIKFSTGVVNVTGGLLTDANTLTNDVNTMTYTGGSTSTLNAMNAAETMLFSGTGARVGVPKVVIVETDGVWNPSTQNPTPAVNTLLANGAEIFAVGVGAGVSPADLDLIAGGDPAHVFSVTDYSGLTTALTEALTEIVPAATHLSYDFAPAAGFSLTGTPIASEGTITPTGGGFTWSEASVNSPAGTTVTISYDEQYTGSTDGAQQLASEALLGYTDDTGTPQSVDYSSSTVDVSGCNRPPVANAGPDQSVALNGSHTAAVTLDGTGSSDPDTGAGSLQYSWTEGSTQLGTGQTPIVTLPIGTHTITLTVTDPEGLTSSDDVTVTVYDPTPPVVTANVVGTQHNGWYTSDAVVSFTVSDPESDVTSESPDCAGVTVDTDTTGTPYTCTATSAGPGSGSASVTVQRDTTGPTVTFGGNAGTYHLGDTVDITCTAADATSGLATPADCGGVTGPAYTFAGGLNTVTRSASDNAGNTTTASTSFTVVVDAAGLCSLIGQWADNGGIANSLCVKLREGNLQPFRNELAAQSGKHIPAAKADIILALSGDL